jgi:hypothetical protein
LFVEIVLPFLYVPSVSTVMISEGLDATLTCRLLYGYEFDQNVQWEWNKKETTSTKVVNSSTLLIINEQLEMNGEKLSQLRFNNALLNDSGIYECVAINSYGRASRSFKLIVKDRKNVIYPLIGIVIIILLTVLIILICDKKKQTINEDDTLTTKLKSK